MERRESTMWVGRARRKGGHTEHKKLLQQGGKDEIKHTNFH